MSDANAGGGSCEKIEVIWCGCDYGFNGNFVSQNCSAQLPRPLRVHPFFHKEGDVKLAKQKNARTGVFYIATQTDYCPNNSLKKPMFVGVILATHCVAQLDAQAPV